MPAPQTPQNNPAQTLEDIWQGAQSQFPGMNKQQFIGKMATFMKDPHNKLIHVGGTTFMISVKTPGVVEFHVLGTKSAQDVVKDSKLAAQTMKRVGAKHLFTFTDDPRMKDLAQATGLPFKVTQSQAMMGGQMKPAWRLDLEL